MTPEELSQLPVKQVVFFSLKQGKYLTENGIEITTPILLEYTHHITNDFGFIILH